MDSKGLAYREGIGYDSQYLNAEQEVVVEELSDTIADVVGAGFNPVEHQKQKHDSLKDFVGYWQAAVPGWGENLLKEATKDKFKDLGSLFMLSGFQNGIRETMKRIGSPSARLRRVQSPHKVAVMKFMDMLEGEVMQVMAGKQKAVAEKDEATQKAIDPKKKTEGEKKAAPKAAEDKAE